VVPSGNAVAEPQLSRMLPEGVAPFYTRLPLRGSSEAELLGMLDGLPGAVRLLADADVDLLIFDCTAATTYSRSLRTTIADRMRTEAGTAAITTADALVAALGALETRNPVMLSPYVPGPHRREIEFITSYGFTVVAEAALGIDTNTEIAALQPDELHDFVIDNRHADADAYVLSCTALRSAELIEVLEKDLGRPVITSNQAMAWYALRQRASRTSWPGSVPCSRAGDCVRQSKHAPTCGDVCSRRGGATGYLGGHRISSV
jgi:maleate isomerase